MTKVTILKYESLFTKALHTCIIYLMRLEQLSVNIFGA